MSCEVLVAARATQSEWFADSAECVRQMPKVWVAAVLLDGSGHDGEIEAVYRLLDDAIEVELTADVGRRVPRPSEAAIERFQTMVADLVDVAVADPAKRTVRFRRARR